ncbi:MAG: hypothetical protein ABW215_09355 [Kibdelosporangium sp.]
MRKKIVTALLAAGCAATLGGCSSSERDFVKELQQAGYTNVGEARTETEKKTKKVGGRTVKSSDKTLEAMVRLKGCDLEFAKKPGQAGYWLDELHVDGQEPDWPGYPENLSREQAEKLLAGSGAKPDGFTACYQP